MTLVIMFWDITNTAFMTSDLLYMTSQPLLRASHHFMYDIKSTVSDLTSTVSVSSHPPYQWYHSHHMYDITTVYMCHLINYIYDIISSMYENRTLCVVDTTLGICVTSFALQMLSHPLYHTKPQYLWCHIHFMHDITCTVSDIALTLSLSSQPLHWYHSHFCMTSYPHYMWHHMHSI